MYLYPYYLNLPTQPIPLLLGLYYPRLQPSTNRMVWIHPIINPQKFTMLPLRHETWRVMRDVFVETVWPSRIVDIELVAFDVNYLTIYPFIFYVEDVDLLAYGPREVVMHLRENLLYSAIGKAIRLKYDRISNSRWKNYRYVYIRM